MDAFADVLGRAGAWCGQNKYLGAIKNAFQNYMPATIAGAIGVLWTNVLVNSGTGLGVLWSGIMVLEFLNPIFSALQYATISCISIGIVMLVAQEIGEANGERGTAYPAVLGFLCWLVVTPTSWLGADLAVTMAEINPETGANITKTVGELLANTPGLKDGINSISGYTGILSSYTAATGLFTALIIGILGLEIYGFLRKQDALKIKMPEQVPPGVSRAFEVLIPTFITLVIVGAIGEALHALSGYYVNDLIYNYVQAPLNSIIGENIFAVMILYVIISLFWLVGIHGNNMIDAIKQAIFKPLLYTNLAIMNGEQQGEMHTINLVMMQMFAEWGGSGVTLGLVIAIFIFGKREDNRAIATLSIVPGLFNINETVTFGIPLVLNPILGIPFILAPVVCVFIGWLLIEIGFCAPIYIEVPWTMPPVIFGFVATGGSWTGAVSQLIVFVVATLIYIPFVIFYERYQNKQAAAAE